MAYLEGKEFGHADLIMLDKVTEEATNDNLRLRIGKGKVCPNQQCITKVLFKQQ